MEVRLRAGRVTWDDGPLIKTDTAPPSAAGDKQGEGGVIRKKYPINQYIVGARLQCGGAERVGRTRVTALQNNLHAV